MWLQNSKKLNARLERAEQLRALATLPEDWSLIHKHLEFQFQVI